MSSLKTSRYLVNLSNKIFIIVITVTKCLKSYVIQMSSFSRSVPLLCLPSLF
jgi:hypothetical protein